MRWLLGRALLAGPATVDDQHERWLIQKDKLDLGPFKLADVKAQIIAGQILGEHVIIDMESGERKRVREHPLLSDLVQRAQGKLEAEHMLVQEAADQRARGRRTFIIAGLVLGAMIAVGGAFAAYLVTREVKEKVVFKEIVKEGGGEDFNFTLPSDFMKVEPPKKKKSGGSKQPGVKNATGDFESAVDFGDGSGEGGDETLPRETVQQVMASNFKTLVGCVKEEKSRDPGLKNVDMEFVIRGSGTVSAVKVNGASNTPFANCMMGKMSSIPFPKFNGAKTVASFSLAFK